jgi:hypothetical protein
LASSFSELARASVVTVLEGGPAVVVGAGGAPVVVTATVVVISDAPVVAGPTVVGAAKLVLVPPPPPPTSVQPTATRASGRTMAATSAPQYPDLSNGLMMFPSLLKWPALAGEHQSLE